MLHHSVVSDSLRTLEYSLPTSSVHGISQAKILEWVSIFFSRQSSWPRDQTHVSSIGRQILYHWDTREAPYIMLLSRFSRVRLCVTPETAAHHASPSLGFSRQEHWSGLPFPSPMHDSEKWKWGRSVVSNSSDPMHCSLPGSSVHGIFQAKVLEWGAIAFSAYIMLVWNNKGQ